MIKSCEGATGRGAPFGNLAADRDDEADVDRVALDIIAQAALFARRRSAN